MIKLDAKWCAVQAATVFCFTTSTYIFAALLRFELVNGKFKGPYLKPAFAMKLIVMLASLSVMACSITIQIDLLVYIGSFNNELRVCAHASKVNVVLIGCGLTFIYMFLWFRQYSFYNQTDFKHLNSKSVRVVSSVTATFIFLQLIAHLFMSTNGQIATWSKDTGCTYIDLDQRLLIYLKGTAAFKLLATLTLFGLFLYPLVFTSTFQSEESGSDVRNEVNRAVRTSVFSVVACIISQTFAIIMGNSFITVKLPSFYFTSCYLLALLVNAISLVFTYDKWKDIILCCRCSRCGRTDIV